MVPFQRARVFDVLIVQTEGAGDGLRLEFTVRRKKVDKSLGWFTADPTGLEAARATLKAARAPSRVLLNIHPAAWLERRLTLPLAAETELFQVLSFEMDRLTPFTVAEVWWNWALVQRDRINKRLHLMLTLVPKAELAHAISTLGRLHLVPAAIGCGKATPIIIDRNSNAHGSPRAVKIAAGGCVALALAVAAAPIGLHLHSIAAVEDRIAALQPQVAEADVLRRRVTTAGAGREALDGEAMQLGSPLRILAALTAALPDDTYLTSLTLRQRQLTFNGRSRNAAKLLTTLADDPVLRDPTFVSPLTRGELGSDIFAIRVGVGR